MEYRGNSRPERIDQILARILVGGRRIVPDSPQGPCALCGLETTHADSIKIDDDREHFPCREKTREDAQKTMIVQQDFLRVAEALGKEGMLFRRLEARLMRYLDKPTANNLCRMITFCLGEIDRDPSIRLTRKAYLRDWLEDIRGSYLPTTN